jgi:hypothetical protein
LLSGSDFLNDFTTGGREELDSSPLVLVLDDAAADGADRGNFRLACAAPDSVNLIRILGFGRIGSATARAAVADATAGVGSGFFAATTTLS